jgi:hypothetical protein
MSGRSKVANLLNISLEAATAYCDEVRQLSGLGIRLPYKAIARCLAKNLNNTSSQTIAEIIKENKFEVLHQGSGNSVQYKTNRKSVKPKPQVDKTPLRLYPDQERVTEDKLKHCPHGIPLIRPCAICDPKKFREMTGID